VSPYVPLPPRGVKNALLHAAEQKRSERWKNIFWKLRRSRARYLSRLTGVEKEAQRAQRSPRASVGSYAS